MSFKTIGMFVGLFLLVGVFASSFVSAGAVILRTVPAQNVWVANGVTEYRMDVYVSNIDYGESTRSINWQLVAPQGFSQHITMTRSQYVLNGFFAGASGCQGMGSFWNPTGISCSLPGVLNSEGKVASYWFTVSPNAPAGQKSFGMNTDNVFVYGPSGDQTYSVQNVPFIVINAPTRIGTAGPHTQAVLTSAQESCPIGQTC